MLFGKNVPTTVYTKLGNWLESYRRTLFRQIKFTECEMIINEMSERGESLSADKYDELI